MSYLQDHLRTCSYCNGTNHNLQTQKPTVRIRTKAASTRRRERALSELASIIRGVSYPGILYAGENKEKKAKTKAPSSNEVEKSKTQKLKELARLIRG